MPRQYTGITPELETRFWSLVQKQPDDRCWNWSGPTTAQGYPRFYAGRAMMIASRLVWQLTNGTVFPANKHACHSCDNPGCVNPDHIWLGTQADNIRDAFLKGRASVPRNNATKTHCNRGHPYAGQKPYPSEAGRKRCRLCHYKPTRERAAA